MVVPSLRFATLGLLCTMALVGCTAGADEDVGSNEDAVVAGAPELLALGDSITFGWDPNLERDMREVEAKRYIGYAELVGKTQGYRVHNASCPGEASGSFLRAADDDNGCDGNRSAFSLKTSWGRHDTQLAAVQEHLRRAIADRRAPALITMTIGGNDLGLLEKSCTGALAKPCMAAKLGVYAHRYENNLEATIDAIGATGYQGTVVLLTTYAPDYSDVVQRLALSAFNEQVRDAIRKRADENPNVRVVVADAYAAFKKEADRFDGKTCDAGLLLKNPDGSCDIHPSRKGHEILARTVIDASK